MEKKRRRWSAARIDMVGGGGAALLQSTALLDLLQQFSQGDKERRVYELGELGFYRLELQSY